MKPATAYTYVVASERRRTASRWSLAIHLPNGAVETLTEYRSRAKAIATAKLLAHGAGRVEVRT